MNAAGIKTRYKILIDEQSDIKLKVTRKQEAITEIKI